MGVGDVSALNAKSAWQTPHLDRLAKEGVAFTDAHSSSAVCTPSRYSILTGRYNWRSARKSGVGGGFSPALIEPGRVTVASYLRERGYATAMVGKWHLGLNWAKAAVAKNAKATESDVDFAQPFGGGPLACGFQEFFGISASLDMPPYAWLRGDRVEGAPLQPIAGNQGQAMWRAGPAADGFAHVDVLPREATEALAYIGRQDATTPFFLYLALTAPHTPILPEGEFNGKTKTTVYGDFCVQVDDVVGRVVSALKARGLDANTLVIFTADNGCSPAANFADLKAAHHDSQPGLRGAKADIYEGGHRVPFIVRWPAGIKTSGRLSDELICQSDLLATCAAMIGEKLPGTAGEDSVSMLPVLAGEKLAAPLREAIVHHSINGSFAIRQGAWKLCLGPDSGGWSEPKPGKAPAGSPAFQLFNLQDDPAETTNVIAAHPEVVKRLGALMKSYVERGRSTPGAVQLNAGGTSWAETAWMAGFKD